MIMWFDILRKGHTQDVYSELYEHIKSLEKIVNDPPKLLESYFKEFKQILREYGDELYYELFGQYEEYNTKTGKRKNTENQIDNYQQQLSDVYNRIPKKLKTQKYSISPKTSDAIKLINRTLNKMGSLLMTSDFEFAAKDSNYGHYSKKKDKAMANLSGRKPEHRTTDEIIETLMHEDGHRASNLIATALGEYPYGGFRTKPFFEEMLAYLVEYPFDKRKALWNWLHHPNVIKDKDKDDKLKEIYDKVKEQFGE